MLRYYGAKDVRIMNGGLQKWIREDRPVYQGKYQPGSGRNLDSKQDYSYEIENEDLNVKDIEKIHRIAYYTLNDASNWQIVDTRPSDQFYAEGDGHGVNTRLGHITGSINLPYTELIDSSTGCIKSTKKLA